MANLPQVQNIAQVSSKWKAALDPILANLLVQGQLLQNVQLLNGTVGINHKLNRLPKGWFLVSPQGPAIVYQSASQPNPIFTLTLTSSAAVMTDIWVF